MDTFPTLPPMLWVFLTTLFVCLPIVVVGIALHTGRLMFLSSKQVDLLNAMQQDLEAVGDDLESMRSQYGLALAQLETQNNLLRQLLRAYGHEPDA